MIPDFWTDGQGHYTVICDGGEFVLNDRYNWSRPTEHSAGGGGLGSLLGLSFFTNESSVEQDIVFRKKTVCVCVGACVSA